MSSLPHVGGSKSRRNRPTAMQRTSQDFVNVNEFFTGPTNNDYVLLAAPIDSWTKPELTCSPDNKDSVSMFARNKFT